MSNLRINGEVHIPNPAPALATLCGFLDEMFSTDTDRPATCAQCLEVVRFCKSIRLKRVAPAGTKANE